MPLNRTNLPLNDIEFGSLADDSSIKAVWRQSRPYKHNNISNLTKKRRQLTPDAFPIIKLAGSLLLLFFAAIIVAGQFWNQNPTYRSHIDLGDDLSLQRLREMGEIAARRHPGVVAMNVPLSLSAFQRTDWAAVKQSCTPALSTSNTHSTSNPPSPTKIILVTGSAGFIGMHAAIALRKQGHGVVGLDNFNDYYPTSLKRARQAHAADTAGVYTVDGDINDKEMLTKLTSICGGFTHVVHMAAQAGVRYATKHPSSYVYANLAGMVTLLEAIAAQRQHKPALVYASSSSVYGLNAARPFSEDDRVDKPASLYAATKRVRITYINRYKSTTSDQDYYHFPFFSLSYIHIPYIHIDPFSPLSLSLSLSLYLSSPPPFLTTQPIQADELMAHVYHHLHGISAIGLRFFTVYGPWGRPDMAAYKFAVSIVKGDPLPIFQGPKNGQELSRDFTYIDDAVAGILSAVATVPPSQPSAAINEVYNIGNTHPHTVTDLVDTLEKYLGVVALRRYLPLPSAGDVLETYADVSKAKQALGYAPVTTLDDGIAKFIDWFFSYYGTALDDDEDGRLGQPQDWSYRPL
jgi:UDP-glucuronate 4-epimerase